MEKSTPREKLNNISDKHTVELKRVQVLKIICSLLGITAFFVNMYFIGEMKGLLFYLVFLPSLLLLYLSLKRKTRWLDEFNCPECKKNLSYFLTDPEYFQNAGAYLSLPESVTNCPFCHISFDKLHKKDKSSVPASLHF